MSCQAVAKSTCRLRECQGGLSSEVLHRGSEEGRGLAKKITTVVNEVLSEEACAGPKSLSQVPQQQPVAIPEFRLCFNIGNSRMMASLLAELKRGRMQGRHCCTLLHVAPISQKSLQVACCYKCLRALLSLGDHDGTDR